MDFIKDLFDPYDRRARLYPALLTCFPVFLSIAVWTPSLYKTGVALFSLVVGCGVLYGFTQFTRTLGRSLEKRLWHEWGGPPTTLWLRRSTDHLNENTRRRYIHFLERNIPNWKEPDPEEELKDPKKANQIYGSAIDWLRNRTRDSKTYPLIFKENVNYGFRRNTLALKPFAMPLALISFSLGVFPFYKTTFITQLTEILPQIATAIISLSLLIWWVFGVNKIWVQDSGNVYARTILGACDQ